MECHIISRFRRIPRQNQAALDKLEVIPFGNRRDRTQLSAGVEYFIRSYLRGMTMTDLTEKEVLLENSSYRYHFDRMIYFNRSAKRAFSLEFVEDKSKQEIQRLLSEVPSANGWIFHFNNEPPSERVKRELAETLGG